MNTPLSKDVLNKFESYDSISLLLYAAYASCFQPNEYLLSSFEIQNRKFALNHTQCKTYLHKLIEDRLITSHHSAALRSNPWSTEQQQYFLRPIYDRQVILKGLSTILKSRMDKDRSTIDHFVSDYFAQECIEVIDSFLQQSGITLIGAKTNDLTLQFLLLNISRNKLFTLCWRTLLHFKKLNYHGEDFILFEEIISRINGLYGWHKNGNGFLKPYDTLMKTHSTLISTFLIEKVLNIKKHDFSLNDIVNMQIPLLSNKVSVKKPYTYRNNPY